MRAYDDKRFHTFHACFPCEVVLRAAVVQAFCTLGSSCTSLATEKEAACFAFMTQLSPRKKDMSP